MIGKISGNCPHCGSHFIKQGRAKDIAAGRGKYCSRSCAAIHTQKINGSRVPRNKSGNKIDSRGYVLISSPNHPNKDVRGYVAEHRLVVEARIGRLLRSEEEVHHINEIKNDNRECNLQLVTKAEHRAIHSKFWILVDGKKLTFRDACRLKNISHQKVNYKAHTLNINRQEAFDLILNGDKRVAPYRRFSIDLNGEAFGFVKACKIKKVNRLSVLKLMKKENITRQQAFDSIVKRHLCR